MIVVGQDPSMRNWGLVAGRLNHDLSLTVTDMLCIQADKRVTHTKQVRNNVKDLDKAHVIVTELAQFLRRINPEAIFIEVPVGSQNARAMCSYGMCIGILAAARSAGFPFYLLTPKQVKLALAGKASASKKEMIQEAVQRHPEAPWPVHQGELVESKAEHLADAIGAIYAGIHLTDFQNVTTLLRRRYANHTQTN